MFVKLQNGSEAKLWVSHTKFAAKKGDRRATVVSLTVGDDSIQVSAVCNEKDNFSKKIGRKLAAAKLLAVLRHEQFTKQDRAKIFYSICPGFAPNAR